MGIDAIRTEFIRRLVAANLPIDTLSIYWDRGFQFMLTNRVEEAMRKLVYGGRRRVVGEFRDLWLLCYPDEADIKVAVEREIDRMVSAVKALVGA